MRGRGVTTPPLRRPARAAALPCSIGQWGMQSGRRPAPTQLARSHSTGHSLVVQLDRDLERFTLRLPEHVRREMVAVGEHSSQLRRGRRAGEGSNRGGRSAPLGRLSFFSASRMSVSSDGAVAMAASRAGVRARGRPAPLPSTGEARSRAAPAMLPAEEHTAVARQPIPCSRRRSTAGGRRRRSGGEQLRAARMARRARAHAGPARTRAG
ncbi:E3 ubiquitin-protein ligase ATL31-like [Panicum miliaceum]|uniref:E3 ubiquitin-protein ligase ATL31-like n=1 Tax=Panicum miliaceum TaxID=4540 RepID=A0A3L6RVY5_PANMI|nr:E3 ubiquitin-protein ligase ATL31-like [Panicum miliaceum]